MLKNKVIATGQIINVGNTHGFLVADYTYMVNGKFFKGSQPENVSSFYGKFLTWKFFPVVFDELDTNNSEMLIYPADFMRFDITFPGSLSWVEKFE